MKYIYFLILGILAVAIIAWLYTEWNQLKKRRERQYYFLYDKLKLLIHELPPLPISKQWIEEEHARLSAMKYKNFELTNNLWQVYQKRFAGFKK
jgi:uncharacterized protein involved in outer membrane biogenesis